MKGVVLAAGEGTRLRPQTAERPKGLVEVAGKPLLAHPLGTLVDLGVDELVVVVGYRGGQIVDRFGYEFDGVPVSYAWQHEQRGLAHALHTAEARVDGPFVVLNGDNVFRANLERAVDVRRWTEADAALVVEEVTRVEATRTGVCVTDDEGSLVRVVERPDDPPSRLVLTGFFAFSPAIFDACRSISPSDRGEYELTDAIDSVRRRGGRVETVPLDGHRVNVNTAADLTRAEHLLAEANVAGPGDGDRDGRGP